MKDIRDEEINVLHGVSLEESASKLTQGNQFCWGEAWSGFRGKGNC